MGRQGLALKETRPPTEPDPQAPSGKDGASGEKRREAARAALLTGPVLPTLIKLALPTMLVLVAQDRKSTRLNSSHRP